jgi:hypothetical protein
MRTVGYRRAAGVVLAAAVLTIAGCTGSPASSGDHRTPSTASGGATAAGSQRPPSATIPDLPDGDASRRTLTEVHARHGGFNAGTFEAALGDLVLRSDCTGGTLTMRVDPVATIPIACATDGVTPAQNVVVLRQARQVTIRIDAPDTVLWNLRVEQ